MSHHIFYERDTLHLAPLVWPVQYGWTSGIALPQGTQTPQSYQGSPSLGVIYLLIYCIYYLTCCPKQLQYGQYSDDGPSCLVLILKVILAFCLDSRSNLQGRPSQVMFLINKREETVRRHRNTMSFCCMHTVHEIIIAANHSNTIFWCLVFLLVLPLYRNIQSSIELNYLYCSAKSVQIFSEATPFKALK